MAILEGFVRLKSGEGTISLRAFLPEVASSKARKAKRQPRCQVGGPLAVSTMSLASSAELHRWGGHAEETPRRRLGDLAARLWLFGEAAT